MATEGRILGLFDGFGIELEYMIVDCETLAVRPIADCVIEAEHGSVSSEIERGPMAWSNELALHLIELKTNGPVPRLSGLAEDFAGEVERIETLLAPLGARLMPTGMHPWMDPTRELRIWPHSGRLIYQTFDRIFDCRGHGWANLQSTHLNLPFANDDEFGRLHAAVRAILPILPALAASSPFVEGSHSGILDTRLDFYRSNARRVPSVTGQVIPEPVFTRAGYQTLLESIYADLAPLDSAGTLRHEWANARGCIARFDRMALEIRLLDVQECPRADLAIAAAVSSIVRALCDPAPAHQARLRSLETRRLAQLLARTMAEADLAKVDDRGYLLALGLDGGAQVAGELWRALVDRHLAPEPVASEHLGTLEVMLEEGCLSRRILRRVGQRPARDALTSAYRELCDCLRERRLFRVGG
jgi:gamma-glutamyl:cysteine ligase YbdK (ATP-grasp superfamily)